MAARNRGKLLIHCVLLPYIERMRPIHLTAVVASLLLAAPAVAQGVVEVGDTPNFQLGSQSYNTMGKSSAANFRGKPTLVEFWGTK